MYLAACYWTQSNRITDIIDLKSNLIMASDGCEVLSELSGVEGGRGGGVGLWKSSKFI